MPKRFFSLELLLSFDTSCKQRSCFQAKQISGRQFLSNFWLNNFSHPSLSAATPLNPSDPISKKAKCLEELSYILRLYLWKSDQSKGIFSQSDMMFFSEGGKLWIFLIYFSVLRKLPNYLVNNALFLIWKINFHCRSKKLKTQKILFSPFDKKASQKSILALVEAVKSPKTAKKR